MTQQPSYCPPLSPAKFLDGSVRCNFKYNHSADMGNSVGGLDIAGTFVSPLSNLTFVKRTCCIQGWSHLVETKAGEALTIYGSLIYLWQNGRSTKWSPN
jgi:hypothetical protein